MAQKRRQRWRLRVGMQAGVPWGVEGWGQVRAELEALHDHASALSALSEQSFQVAATEALARQQ